MSDHKYQKQKNAAHHMNYPPTQASNELCTRIITDDAPTCSRNSRPKDIFLILALDIPYVLIYSVYLVHLEHLYRVVGQGYLAYFGSGGKML